MVIYTIFSYFYYPAGNPPDDFVGSYKLEYDMTFTPLEKVTKRQEEISRVRVLTKT